MTTPTSPINGPRKTPLARTKDKKCPGCGNLIMRQSETCKACAARVKNLKRFRDFKQSHWGRPKPSKAQRVDRLA